LPGAVTAAVSKDDPKLKVAMAPAQPAPDFQLLFSFVPVVARLSTRPQMVHFSAAESGALFGCP